MIDRREILDTASLVSLNAHVVEKDYVLGWMLAGIEAHAELKDSWMFKGGTCLKKCFFETWRFSEDLDFTLLNPAHIDEKFLKRVFSEIGQWVYEESGIDTPTNIQNFDIYENPRGGLSCQGKIGYRGPISPQGKNIPRIKIDLTSDELLVLPPVRTAVFHPYSDAPHDGIQALTYSYAEAFGEKIRALAERTRPRDLYDVINLFRNASARPAASLLLDILCQKCAFKNIAIPSLADLAPHRANLDASWQNMLAHQLPALLPVESFWNELPAFFAWLEGGADPNMPPAFAVGSDETVLRDRFLKLSVTASVSSCIEVIRFAAFNRHCVELDYRDENGRRTTKIIEPYSLRQTTAGAILLYVYDVEKNVDNTVHIDRIGGVRVTSKTFIPRYEIELSP